MGVYYELSIIEEEALRKYKGGVKMFESLKVDIYSNPQYLEDANEYGTWSPICPECMHDSENEVEPDAHYEIDCLQCSKIFTVEGL